MTISNPELTLFLSGALMTSYLITGLFFYRFWTQTKDSLFKAFSLAFVMLGVERLVLLSQNTLHEERTLIYLIRLVAFIIIIVAILQKNFAKSKNS